MSIYTTTTIAGGVGGYPDGNSLGQSATDKISFFGADYVVQPTNVADTTSVTTAAAIAVSGGFGMSTSAQLNSLVAVTNAQTVAINAILTRLETLGLFASS